MKTYRVRHEKIRFGVFSTLYYGPYRWYILAIFVAWWKCGEYDACTVEST